MGTLYVGENRKCHWPSIRPTFSLGKVRASGDSGGIDSAGFRTSASDCIELDLNFGI